MKTLVAILMGILFVWAAFLAVALFIGVVFVLPLYLDDYFQTDRIITFASLISWFGGLLGYHCIKEDLFVIRLGD